MKTIIAALLVMGGSFPVSAAGDVRLALACNPNNDLYRVLTENKGTCVRFDSAAAAVQAVDPGGGVLILADRYPQETIDIDPAVWEQAAEKELRLYVEYPGGLPGVEVGRPKSTHVERVVVHSDFFGDEMFLDRAETALQMTMAQYTDGWRWTNGLAQEKARILLPLAWLVRVKDTPENRAMLRKAADGLLALQDECGAIREELGLPGRGQYPPPRSNAAYGNNEASLIANSGDPVSQLRPTLTHS